MFASLLCAIPAAARGVSAQSVQQIRCRSFPRLLSLDELHHFFECHVLVLISEDVLSDLLVVDSLNDHVSENLVSVVTTIVLSSFTANLRMAVKTSSSLCEVIVPPAAL